MASCFKFVNEKNKAIQTKALNSTLMRYCALGPCFALRKAMPEIYRKYTSLRLEVGP